MSAIVGTTGNTGKVIAESLLKQGEKAAEQAMLGIGLSADVERNFIEMYRAFNEGRVTGTEGHTQAHNTATSFETFATVFGAGA